MEKIKRIIFDLDNTLIMWKDEYLEGLKRTLEEYNIDFDYKKLNDTVDAEYEDTYPYYTKENLKKFIKDRLNLEVSIEVITAWLDSLYNMSDANPEVNDVLSYLSAKYELVVLTNWFKDSQEKRLIHANMRQFFKEIIGGDEHIKPSIEAYKEAMGPYRPIECLMVGDSIRLDVEGAINAGIKPIHLSQTEPIDGVTTIKNLSELKKIL